MTLRLSPLLLSIPASMTLVGSFLGGCPEATLLGQPCDSAGEEICEDVRQLRCDGVSYVLAAECHFECVSGEGTSHPGGERTASETWTCLEGPHIIAGNIEFKGGATLTIEPGASVRLEGSTHVDIAADSRVVVDAQPTAPVLVTSNNGLAGGFGTPSSGGLNVFATNDVDPSVLRHVIVERGIVGLGVFGLDDAVTPPTIERCTFRDNQSFGIRVSCDSVGAGIPDFDAAGNLFFGNGQNVSACEAP